MASVNVMKVTRANVNGIDVHLDNEKREKRNHANKHINKELTKYNYFIGCKDWNECKRSMDARTAEADAVTPPKRKVKDRIVATMMEIPVPQAITDQGKADEFLKASFEQLQKLYGAENVHGMAVHKDEVHEYRDKDGSKKTSLIHAHALVSAYATWKANEKVIGADGNPVRDENNKIVKELVEVSGINGKNFVTRPMLNKLQSSFNEMCMEKFGMEYQTHGEVRNKSVEELKKESEYAAAVVERMEEYEKTRTLEINQKIEDAAERSKTLQNENKELQAENDAMSLQNYVLGQNTELLQEKLDNVTQDLKQKRKRRDELSEEIELHELEKSTLIAQNEDMSNQLEQMIVAHDEKMFELQDMKEEIESLTSLQEFSRKFREKPMPKMNKQFVGSGTVVHDDEENVRRAYNALQVAENLKDRANELIELQRRIEEEIRQHEEEYREKMFTAKKKAQYEVAEERAAERKRVKQLEKKLETAEFNANYKQQFIEQSGLTEKYMEWTTEQKRKSMRELEQSIDAPTRKYRGIEIGR